MIRDVAIIHNIINFMTFISGIIMIIFYHHLKISQMFLIVDLYIIIGFKLLSYLMIIYELYVAKFPFKYVFFHQYLFAHKFKNKQIHTGSEIIVMCYGYIIIITTVLSLLLEMNNRTVLWYYILSYSLINLYISIFENITFTKVQKLYENVNHEILYA